MTRLRYMIILAAGTAIPGALVILVLAFGFYNAWAIFGAAILGAVLAYPASVWVARLIKTEDPEWDEKTERPIDLPPSARPEKV